MAITDRERLLHESYQGWSDIGARKPVARDTLFQIGSISKSFTSVALLRLSEKGLVDLNGPVEQYVPWFKTKSSHGTITLHHLMTHTAGLITGTEETLAAETEVLSLAETEMGAAPGEYFHYSNSGYKLLGLVLEAVTGKKASEAVMDYVVRPLGMSSTWTAIVNDLRERTAVGYVPFYDDRPLPNRGRLAPGPWIESDTADGSISSTAEDMAKYVRMLLNRGMGPRGPIISEESFLKLVQKATRSDESSEEYYGYGLCTIVSGGRTLIGHTGGMVGYVSEMSLDMNAGIGLIVMINANIEVQNIARDVMRVLQLTISGEPLPELAEFDPLAVQGAQEYAGCYLSSARRAEVSTRGQRLFLRMGGVECPLEPRTKDSFVADHPELRLFRLVFERRGGEVVGMAHGPEWFVREGSPLAEPPESPASWQAYVGHYRSHNPWLSNFRVILRRGSLLLVYPSGEEQPLVPLGEHLFRMGKDARSPERLQFRSFLNGRPFEAVLSGMSYYRSFTP